MKLIPAEVLHLADNWFLSSMIECKSLQFSPATRTKFDFAAVFVNMLKCVVVSFCMHPLKIDKNFI